MLPFAGIMSAAFAGCEYVLSAVDAAAKASEASPSSGPAHRRRAVGVHTLAASSERKPEQL